MTVLNQHPSEVTKLVEAGETVQVTRHGKAVLRLVPEPTAADPLGPLIAAGLVGEAVRPQRAPHRAEPLLSEQRADEALAWLSEDTGA